jgi:hypothetical protein
LATPNIVPQATGEGSIGTTAKKWADVQANKINGKELTTVAKADSIPVTEAGGKLNGGLLGTHSHTTTDVTDLTTTLDAGLATKANASHTHGGEDVTSAVATATKLATARTISLTGDVTGSASFDGSANASITATVADDSHNHTIANVDNLQTTLDGKVPTGRTVTAGNGLTGGGALSANITLTMGTPGSCSTATTNSVTSTSHTHAITGVAASSHTHSYQPIPTSSVLPVGTLMFMVNLSTTLAVANGGTISGSNLKPVTVGIGSSRVADVTFCTAQAGTWKNISGYTVSNISGVAKYSGLFVRTA